MSPARTTFRSSKEQLCLRGPKHSCDFPLPSASPADFVLLPCVGGSQGCAGAVLQHDAHEEGAPGYYKARVGFPSSTSGAAHVDVEVTAALRGGLLRARFGGLGERRLRVSLQTRLDALEGKLTALFRAQLERGGEYLGRGLGRDARHRVPVMLGPALEIPTR